MKKARILFILTFLLQSPIIFAYTHDSMEIDDVGLVFNVIDGDTFDAFPVGRIRLADINAYECGTCIGDEAKSFLSSLIANKIVYLDVDDIYAMDNYNRLVCLVYVRHNSTHIKNVNKALLNGGYATMSDFNNEFNWENWTLFVKYPEENAPEETYSELLSNYLELKKSYYELDLQYINSIYNQNDLNTTITKLRSDFNALNEIHDALNLDYNELLSLHDELQIKNTQMKADYDALNNSYMNLLQDFEEHQNNLLKSDYDKILLESNIFKIAAICLTISLAATILLTKKAGR